MTTTRIAPCAGCGAPQERQLAEGEGTAARILNALEPRCPGCVAVEEERDRRARGEQDRKERDTRAALRRQQSGLDRHLWDFGFSSIAAELGDGLALARRWARGETNGAVLGGPVGVGKTRLAAAATNLMLARRRVRWFSGPRLLACLGSGGFDSPPRVAALAALTGTEALVLDDIDKVRATEYAAEIVFLAIDVRCDGAAPLLVTTNLAPGELAERWPQPYGEAIASRLSLLPGAHVDGVDRRRRAVPAGELA